MTNSEKNQPLLLYGQMHKSFGIGFALNPFVGVRVAEIQTTLDREHWKYVSTAINPADDISRGIVATEVNGRWIHDPDFLQESSDTWSKEPTQQVEDKSKLKRVKPIYTLDDNAIYGTNEPFSNWMRLLRITAYCFRWIHNVRDKTQEKRTQRTLQCHEIDQTKTYWIPA